jgi:site-specific recombinase XerD
MTMTVSQAINKYLDNISMVRSQNTARSYGNALRLFEILLNKRDLVTEFKMVRDLPVDAIAWFAMDLKKYAPATESLYLTAVAGFYDYLAAENLADPNLPKLRMLIRQRSRRYGPRLPQFPRSQIEDVLNYAATLATLPYKNEAEGLRNLRDRAFLLTLADTGLRVHEACGLRRGDIDWNEGKAMIIGKGDRQDVVRFSNRCMKAIRDYLKRRATIDGASGRPLSSLPLFSRHDRGAGKKIKPITTGTGRNIVSQRVKEALGSQAVGQITPHSFRHYFVTTVLHGSGGKLKLAQELARHKNIAVTQRYAHLSDDELDRGYWEIFEER